MSKIAGKLSINKIAIVWQLPNYGFFVVCVIKGL